MFGVRHGRTRLVKSLARPPFVVQRTFYLDSQLDDMAFVFLANPTAGIFQGDRQSISIIVGPDAKAHVTNQSATKVHAMPESSAAQETGLVVEDCGYLEYLPEPLIPFGGSRFSQKTRINVAPTGMLLYWEIIAQGRIARGENLAYERLENRLTVRRPGGSLLYHETFRLEPRARSPLSMIILGSVAAPVLGSLLVVTGALDAQSMADRLRNEAPNLLASPQGVRMGVTCLPYEAGVGVKVLGPEIQPVKRVLTAMASAARELLTGAPLPPSRKY